MESRLTRIVDSLYMPVVLKQSLLRMDEIDHETPVAELENISLMHIVKHQNFGMERLKQLLTYCKQMNFTLKP